MKTEPTIDEQIAELEREIGKRAETFPRWVNQGQKTQVDSDRQMAAIRAALKTLVGVKAAQQKGASKNER